MPPSPAAIPPEHEDRPDEVEPWTEAVDRGPYHPSPGVYSLPGLEPRASEEHFTASSPGSPPDIAADAFRVEDLAVRAASVRGVAHRYYGDPRQDSYAVGVTGDGRWLVVAVADGLGSGARSHRGARTAATTVVRLCCSDAFVSSVEDVDWGRVFRSVAQKVGAVGHQLAAESAMLHIGDDNGGEGDPESAVATTLIVVVLPVAGAAERREAHAAWIGDSGVWRLRGTTWSDLARAKGRVASVSSSATGALPFVDDDPDTLRFDVAPGDVIAVVTDGVGDMFGSGGTPMASTFAEWWAMPPATSEFVSQVDLRLQSFDDDRTAVVVWMDDVPAESPVSRGPTGLATRPPSPSDGPVGALAPADPSPGEEVDPWTNA